MSQTNLKESVRIGICGLGTVGGGTVNILAKNKTLLESRTGIALELAHIGVRRDREDIDTSVYKVSRDIFEVARDPDIDVLVELIGGTTVAKDLVLEALNHGKSVVTANKALIATHGNEILALAKQKGLSVYFEAAVAGGIPIIKSLVEGLSANHIEVIAGIINGTGNYILSEMRDKGRSFSEALADAQQLGYAEADPTFDIEGIDAAQKLVILSALAFGLSLDADRCFTEGISNIKVDDIHFADLLGYQIKHLGIAKRHGDQIELRVHPTLVSNSQLIANVNGVMNAVQVRGDSVGETLYYGAGAGAEPTASAVIADIVEAAKNISVGAIKTYACGTSNAAIMPIEESESAWYMRIPVVNQSGVLLEITGALSAQSISVHAIQQPETSSELAQVVLTTNKVKQAVLDAAVEKIKTLDIVDGEIVTIRLEQFS